MDADSQTLREQVSGLLGWEKRKRRETVLIAALCHAFLAALAVPLIVAIPQGWAWAAPAAIFAVLMPLLLFLRRWRDRDTARALAALDRKLALDERVTTAWEFVRRNETKAVALLVLRQASERVKGIDVRSLFPRSWDRHVYLLPPLLALWLALHIFDARFQVPGVEPAHPPPLSGELREFARRLQEKARSEGLPQALEAGRELERIAKRSMDAGTADEALKSELAGLRRKLAAERQAAEKHAAGQAPFGAGASRRELDDLRTELEAAREWSGAPDSERQSLEDLLGGLSQLRKQWDRSERQQEGARGLGRDDMKAFLDRLEERVAAELDRRALRDTERFLEKLERRGEGSDGETRSQAGRSGERDGPGEGRRERDDASAAGKGPAGKPGGVQASGELKGGAPSRLKGTIGAGERSGIDFKGKPAPGRTEISQDEVLATYRRQAEAELDTERIPGELKDAIKAYFLSLDKVK